MNSRGTLILILLLLTNEMLLQAQLSISSDVPVTVTFGTTLSGVNNSSFTGTGFKPTPESGRLNSHAWEVFGFSDGDLNFGGVGTAGSLARGTITMGTNPTVAGIYAYTGTPFSITDPAILIQPADDDFSPGSITLKIVNNHPWDNITELDVSYDLWYRNNEARSNTFDFSWSTDNVTYTSVPALDFTTPTTADAAGFVNVGTESTAITGISVVPGGFIYIRWSSDIAGGTLRSDELLLNSITISDPLLVLPIQLSEFTGTPQSSSVLLQWTTASEQNSDYFQPERSADGVHFQALSIVDAAGNSDALQAYTFEDDAPFQGMNYYRLKQADIDGSYFYSDIIAVPFAEPGHAGKIVILSDPAGTSLFLQIQAAKQSECAYAVLEPDGRIVQTGIMQLESGNNSVTLSIGNLPAGFYIFRLEDGDTPDAIPFIRAQ